LAALRSQVDAVYLSSCDVPFLQPAFVSRMVELLGENSICVPYVEGFHHPLAAVYRSEVATSIDSLLEANRLRPVFLFDMTPTRIVTAAELSDVDPTFQSLRNLNTPAEYEAALRELAND
jgi:molybdopterin-guanine dinucleotide biosynthesis protein A